MIRAGCSRIALFIFLVGVGTGAAYSETTALSVSTGEATAVMTNSAELHGIINPGGIGAAGWFEWGTTTSLGNRTDVQMFGDGTSALTFTASLRDLQPHTTYYFRAVGYRMLAGAGTTFGDTRNFTTTGDATPTTTLTVTTNEATTVTSNSVVLNGTVSAGGSPIAGWFEWGTTTSLGNRTDTQASADGTTVTLTQSLRNLQPHTTYYFRAVGYRSGGTNVAGNVRSFTTAPETPAVLTLTTNDASAVSSNSAELRGVINPGGNAATTWFEWGSTTPLPNQTTPQTFEGGTSSQNYAYLLADLQPNTTYYFRAAGRNAGGTVRGDVKTFTTARVPSTSPQTISEVEHGAIKSGYVIITPDPGSAEAPSTTLTFGTVNNGAVQSQAGIIPMPMATDATMFVEVIPSISRNVGVAIVNPGGSVNAVTLTLRDETGFVLGSPAIVSVPAHQQVAKFVHQLFGSDVIASGFRGSLRMQSASPFGVTGLRFSESIFSTLPVALKAPASGVPLITLTAGSIPNGPSAGTIGGSTALIVPQFALAGGWATHIVLINNTNATLVGRIDVFDVSGNPMAVKLNGETRSTFPYSIPVGGTFVLAPRDLNGQSPL